jgi:hypothetical protein
MLSGYAGRSLRSYQVINYIFSGIIILVIIYSGFFSPVKDNYPVPCVHELATGQPCPSCGLSHSFSYIVRGDLQQATEWNRYGIRVFLFFLFQLVMRVSMIFTLRKGVSDLKKAAVLDICLALITFALAFSQFISYNSKLLFPGN